MAYYVDISFGFQLQICKSITVWFSINTLV